MRGRGVVGSREVYQEVALEFISRPEDSSQQRHIAKWIPVSLTCVPCPEARGSACLKLNTNISCKQTRRGIIRSFRRLGGGGRERSGSGCGCGCSSGCGCGCSSGGGGGGGGEGGEEEIEGDVEEELKAGLASPSEGLLLSTWTVFASRQEGFDWSAFVPGIRDI